MRSTPHALARTAAAAAGSWSSSMIAGHVEVAVAVDGGHGAGLVAQRGQLVAGQPGGHAAGRQQRA